MIAKPGPLLFTKLHALPIIKPAGILLAKGDAEFFFESTFRLGDMGLKLNCVSTRMCNRIDKSVGHAQAAFVRLGYFTYDQGRLPGTNFCITNRYRFHGIS